MSKTALHAKLGAPCKVSPRKFRQQKKRIKGDTKYIHIGI